MSSISDELEACPVLILSLSAAFKFDSRESCLVLAYCPGLTLFSLAPSSITQLPPITAFPLPEPYQLLIIRLTDVPSYHLEGSLQKQLG
jgi:hypothetical protein